MTLGERTPRGHSAHSCRWTPGHAGQGGGPVGAIAASMRRLLSSRVRTGSPIISGVGTWEAQDLASSRPIAALLERCAELLGVDLATIRKAAAEVEPYLRLDAPRSLGRGDRGSDGQPRPVELVKSRRDRTGVDPRQRNHIGYGDSRSPTVQQPEQSPPFDAGAGGSTPLEPCAGRTVEGGEAGNATMVWPARVAPVGHLSASTRGARSMPDHWDTQARTSLPHAR